MDLTNSKKAIKEIAKRDGKSINAVRKEIQIAIDQAYSNPLTHAQWTALFGEGVRPTPEEFVEVVSADLLKIDFKFWEHII